MGEGQSKAQEHLKTPGLHSKSETTVVGVKIVGPQECP